jgi:sec-independent protein translocase protein TatC
LKNSVIALLCASLITFWFSETLYALLAKPLVQAWVRADLGAPQLNFGSLIEPFWVYFKVAMYAGVFLASPFIFHQIWRFIAPGLYQKERRVALPFAVFSALFFIGGAAFCYAFVLPAAFDFFLGYASANLGKMSSVLGSLGADFTVMNDPLKVTPTLFMEQYLDLTIKMLLGFGIIFEMPLLIFFLSWVGLVTHKSLWKFNKYAIVLAFVIGAILTPGPDMMSQFLMAAPMIVLYQASILIAFVVTRRRAKNEEAPPPDVAPDA